MALQVAVTLGFEMGVFLPHAGHRSQAPCSHYPHVCIPSHGSCSPGQVTFLLHGPTLELGTPPTSPPNGDFTQSTREGPVSDGRIHQGTARVKGGVRAHIQGQGCVMGTKWSHPGCSPWGLPLAPPPAQVLGWTPWGVPIVTEAGFPKRSLSGVGESGWLLFPTQPRGSSNQAAPLHPQPGGLWRQGLGCLSLLLLEGRREGPLTSGFAA